MRRLFFMQVLVAWLVFATVGVPWGQAAPNLRTMRNHYFEVVGLDLRSVSYVNELSAYSVEIAQRYLEREGLAFPQPILISLRPEAHVDFEGDYRVRLAERNSVCLDLRWEDDMTLKRTCRGIAEALLRQYAVFNYGTGAAANLRAWPVEALAGEIYYGLRAAEFVESLQRRRGLPPLVLTEVVEALQSEVSMSSDSGYWLLSVMKASGLKRDRIIGLFQQATAGIDVEEAITSAIQPNSPTAEPVSGQVWFAEQLTVLLAQEYDVIESMDTSRTWLAKLASLEEPLQLESGVELKLNLRSLWTHRAEPAVRARIQARYEILLLRMSRINPAYFNPARSLGVLFEGILQEVPAHQYLHYLAIYLTDWEDAKEMQAELERHL
ncbi:hypothetical protein SH580_19175 [Coraliomargarita algicola]|uniref:DUF1570 domain-containing protein n=1 Tax=Coraliomargarita algicola TaxID=3092156 RepID=A0ABZ0RKB2_9BACT|nr:hypothetical protein [Coraliomargarita sp. J2-16]WPJ95543.1 hypothetical protein SH580_19175 [Coraliomargarita sp. J2-16]